MSTGRGKGHIPWTWLQQSQSDYILDEYLPPGIILTQYHHIRSGDANALLQHWTARQAAGEIPFRFKKTADTSQQRTRTSVRGDSPGSDSSGSAENGREGDTDGTGSGQAQGGNGEFQGDGEESEAESGPSEVSILGDCFRVTRSLDSGLAEFPRA